MPRACEAVRCVGGHGHTLLCMSVVALALSMMAGLSVDELHGRKLPDMVNTRSARHTASLPLLRAVRVGRNPVALAVDERAGRVFVVGAAGSVTVLDATTGAVVRTVAVGRRAQSVAVDEATERAFVTDPGRVFTLDARTGAVLRASPLGGGIQAGPVIDDAHGEVFVATRGVGRGPAGPGPASV